MIDIHSHILYDIEGDDGSRSKEMSLAMLQMAWNAGTTDMIATPHMHRRGVVPSWDSITERTASLQEEARKAGIPIHIYPGAEVSFDADTLNYLPEGGDAYCLAGTKYILVELLPSSAPQATSRLLYELQLRGYMPILAHPERYPHIMEQPEHLLHWVENGLLCQSNMGSFAGQFGAQTEQYAKWLYQHHAIHFLGSDAHRTDWRSPDVRAFHQAIDTYTGSSRFWDSASEHASYIIRNKIYYADPPVFEVKRRKRGLLARLFGK